MWAQGDTISRAISKFKSFKFNYTVDAAHDDMILLSSSGLMAHAKQHLIHINYAHRCIQKFNM